MTKTYQQSDKDTPHCDARRDRNGSIIRLKSRVKNQRGQIGIVTTLSSMCFFTMADGRERGANYDDLVIVN